MRWGNWALVVSQHPPILTNTEWGVEIELSGGLFPLLKEILRARAGDLLGEPADPLGLIDSVGCLTDRFYSLEGEASLPIAAYSYAASYQPTEAELQQRRLEQEQEEFRQQARQRASACRHPDKC